MSQEIESNNAINPIAGVGLAYGASVAGGMVIDTAWDSYQHKKNPQTNHPIKDKDVWKRRTKNNLIIGAIGTGLGFGIHAITNDNE